MNFYQRLRDVREDHDLTQAQIAKIIGTSQTQYGRWESGKWQMPIEHYKTLARYYNCSIDFLAGLCSTPTAPGGGPYKITNIKTVGGKHNWRV